MLSQTETQNKKNTPIANPIPLLYALAIIPDPDQQHAPSTYRAAWYYGPNDIREEKLSRRRWRELFRQHSALNTRTINGVYYYHIPANPRPLICTDPEAFRERAEETKKAHHEYIERRNRERQEAYAAGTLKPF